MKIESPNVTSSKWRRTIDPYCSVSTTCWHSHPCRNRLLYYMIRWLTSCPLPMYVSSHSHLCLSLLIAAARCTPLANSRHVMLLRLSSEGMSRRMGCGDPHSNGQESWNRHNVRISTDGLSTRLRFRSCLLQLFALSSVNLRIDAVGISVRLRARISERT